MASTSNLTQLLDAINTRAAGTDRLIVAIAGAPGAGKSTLVRALQQNIKRRFGLSAPVLPMDGYHLHNRILDERGHRARKGAPFTFDAAGYVAALARVHAGQEDVYAPEFVREDDCAHAGAIRIGKEHQLVLTEGNYLLADVAPWAQGRQFFGLTVFIDVPLEELERRLMQRWLDLGLLDNEARRKVESNDLVNARYVLDHSVSADITLGSPTPVDTVSRAG